MELKQRQVKGPQILTWFPHFQMKLELLSLPNPTHLTLERLWETQLWFQNLEHRHFFFFFFFFCPPLVQSCDCFWTSIDFFSSAVSSVDFNLVTGLCFTFHSEGNPWDMNSYTQSNGTKAKFAKLWLRWMSFHFRNQWRELTWEKYYFHSLSTQLNVSLKKKKNPKSRNVKRRRWRRRKKSYWRKKNDCLKVLEILIGCSNWNQRLLGRRINWVS